MTNCVCLETYLWKLFIIFASELSCLMVIRNVADREEGDPIKECLSKPSLPIVWLNSIDISSGNMGSSWMAVSPLNRLE